MPESQKYNELELFSRIAAGEEHSFTLFVELYGPDIQQAIRQVVKTENVVKDLTQDIFLQLWISREKLASLKAPRAWVFRVVYYQCFYWLRQRDSRVRRQQQFFEQNSERPLSEDDHAVFTDTRRLIAEAISALPPRIRQIYQMSRETGLSIAEIAIQLNLSEQTVKNTLSSALQRLRESLHLKGIGLPVALLYFFIN